MKKTEEKQPISFLSEKLAKEIEGWQTTLAKTREELAGIEQSKQTLANEMETYLLDAVRGDAKAELALVEKEQEIALTDAHRRRIDSTLVKIESEIIRLEAEKQTTLKQEAALRIESRMPEVKQLTDEVHQAFQMIDAAIKRLWELSHADQVDGATLGLAGIGSSRKTIHAWHFAEPLDRLRAHAENNKPVGHEDMRLSVPDAVAQSQAALKRDLENALGRKESAVKAA
jgi:hypothetical protein